MAVRTFMDGPWQAKGIMPYMNQKEFFDPNDLSLLAAFAPNSSITFQWLEDGSRPLYTVGVSNPNGQYLSRVFNIDSNGLYGTDERRGAGHFPWVHIMPQAPNTVPLNRLQNEWLFQDFGGVYTVANTGDLAALTLTLPRTQLSTLDLPFLNNNVKGQWEWNTRERGTFYAFHSYAYVTSTQKWWVYTRVNGVDSQLGNPDIERWIPALIKNNTNIQVTFTERFVWNQSLTTGDTTLATIYTAVVPMSDIYHPSWIGGEVFVPNDVYSVCFDGNSRHAYHENGAVSDRPYDAAFLILPPASPIYSQYFERTELNSRVAGEKALYEDEFLTAGQVEAGVGIVLRWRNLAGDVPVDPNNSYGVVPAAGGNLIIESTATGSGNSAVQGRTYGPPATIYYDETTATIRFQDEPLWYTDAMVLVADTKLPIEFDVVGDPVVNPTTSVIRARAVNNNLHCSVTQLNTVNYYPMALANAPVLTDWTVNHIRFVDTQNVTWDVKGDVMPTLMPDNSTAVRQGIIVKPVLNGLYVNWSIRSGNHSYFTQRSNPQQVISNDPNQPLPDAQMSFFPVDSLDGVDFWGKNGVVCTLIGAESNRLQLIIDRKLTIENTSGQAPPNDTTYIRFDNNIGNGTLNTGGGILGSLGLSDPDVNINYIGFSDIGPFTQRVPALQVTFSVHDGLDTQGFNFNNAGAKTVRGFYPRQVGRFASQWSKDFDVLDTYRTISNTQPILEVGFWGWDDGERNILSSNAMYGTFPDSVYVQRVPPNLIGNPDGLALSINFEEGLYYIDATVQGIMGMKQTTPPNQPFNPIISQALHLHLYARPQSNGNNFPDVLTNKVLQSLDVMKNYTVVPYIANQPGQDTHTWYRQANASRPWSMQGGGLFWLRGLEHISTLLTLNAGGYNNDFYYQVCYAKMSCIKVANVADIHTYPKKIDIDTDPTMYNYAPQRWHDMIFF